MRADYTESTAERAALQWLEEIGCTFLSGAAAAPDGEWPHRDDYTQVILRAQLHTALVELNPGLPPAAIAEAEQKILRPEAATLVEANQAFQRYLTDGVPVETRGPDGAPRIVRARIFDLDDFNNNEAVAINQFTVKDTLTGQTARPDIVLFVNGIPLVVIEIKAPGNERTGVLEAYEQLDRYRGQIPGLLGYNGLLVASDGLSARAGSLTAPFSRFMPWRTIDGEKLAPKGEPELETLVRGMLVPEVLLDLLAGHTVFETLRRQRADGSTVSETHKKIAAYHQYHAVRKAVRSVVRAAAPGGSRQGGVVWHTQGSGKSLTMLFLAGRLIQHPAMENPTIVVLTDRNDLDDQLFGTFNAGGGGAAVLRQIPAQAADRADLKEKLKVASGGVVFTTVQKFIGDEALSLRRNIVVIADEAHRSQYGFIDGFARKVREALPNATFVGFTGTPIETQDKDTRGVFGEYVDIYDIQRALDDEATVPIYYESKLVQLTVSDKDDLDAAYAEALKAIDLTPENARGKVRLEDLVGTDARLATVARTIVEHFEARQGAIEGKAMVVCMSRDIAARLYREIRALRPGWHDDDEAKGQMKVVITSGSEDKEHFKPHQRSKGQREALATRFKDPADPFRLAIVCDMWLTGFDVPPLHTMYLDKPMAGHALMQAIARVNRVWGDKPGGLIVDLLGIATQLKEALATYTREGGKGEAAARQASAVPKMQEKHEVAKTFFNGYDYSAFFTRDAAAQVRAVKEGADLIASDEKAKERFLDVVAQLSRAFVVAVPLPETEAVRDDLGYFQAVRAALRKLDPDERPRPTANAAAAVRQVISGAIVSGEVVDIFRAAGLDRPNVAILDETFLGELRRMEQRHLALEALRKLLSDEIRARSRVNVVQGRTFREMLEASMNRYRNRAIDTAEVLDELIGLAHHMRAEAERKAGLKMSEEEVAFYDALATAKDTEAMKRDGTLQALARELTRRIQENASIDWTMKETVRAQMRAMVKRLLRKYKYPPEERDRATETVIEQAERLASLHAEG